MSSSEQGPPEAPVPEEETPSPDRPGAARRADEHLRVIGRGGAALLIGQIAYSGLRFVAMSLIGRGLGAAVLGSFGLIYNVESFTEVLSYAGLPQANLKYIADCLARDDPAGARATARLTAMLSAAFTFALFALLWVFAPLIGSGIYHRPELVLPVRIASLAVLLSGMMVTLLSVPQAARDIRPLLFIGRVGVPALFLGGVAAVVWAKGDLSALVWAYVISTAIGFVAALVMFLKWLWAGERSSRPTAGVREVAAFAAALCAAAIAGLIMRMADVLVLGKFVSDKELGVYVAAGRMAAFVSLPLMAINAVHTPVISDLFARQDMAGLRRTYITTTRWATGAAFGLLGPMVIAPTLLVAFFGKEFRGGGTVLILLGLGQLVNCATGSVGQVLSMTGGQNIVAGTNWACAATLLGGLVFVSKEWGAVGAAAWAGSVIAAVNVARLIWVWRRLGLHPFNLRYGVCCGATALATGLLVPLAQRSTAYSAVALGAFVLIFALVAWYGWIPSGGARTPPSAGVTAPPPGPSRTGDPLA